LPADFSSIILSKAPDGVYNRNIYFDRIRTDGNILGGNTRFFPNGISKNKALARYQGIEEIKNQYPSINQTRGLLNSFKIRSFSSFLYIEFELLVF
jgi:hypothetical protein